MRFVTYRFAALVAATVRTVWANVICVDSSIGNYAQTPFDLDGQNRTQNGNVDLRVYEAEPDLLLKNGFE